MNAKSQWEICLQCKMENDTEKCPRIKGCMAEMPKPLSSPIEAGAVQQTVPVSEVMPWERINLVLERLAMKGVVNPCKPLIANDLTIKTG